MSFNSALTSTQLDKLRGTSSVNPTYSGKQFISLCPNTTIFAARVNQASFTASFAQITYDTVTTGAYTNIAVGQTVYLSATNDIRAAYFVGRVRKTPTSAILYINETSATVTDNDYIFVVNDYRIWEKLARESAGVQLKDYDRTFAQIPPIIYGLQSAYAGVVSGSPSGYTVAFAASAVAGTSGATISSYAYTIPSGGTVTAGSAATANVTVRFDAGFYWVKLVVTDSGSRTATRYIPVWSVPTDFSAQVELGFNGASITGDSSGWNAQIEGFTGIDDVYDGTLCCIWDIERYNGTEGALVSNVKFVGRLRRETISGQGDEQYSYTSTVQFELEGAGAQLSRITAPLLALRYKSSPTLWDQITNLTIWRAIAHILHEHSTFLSLHSLEFDSTANTYLAQLLGTQGGNMFAAVQDLASAINAVMEFDATGKAQVVRDARYLTTAERVALTTVSSWEDDDFLDLGLDIDHAETTGRVDGSGGTFNTTSNIVTPLLAIAPGVAQGTGESRTSLARQILTANVASSTAQSELNTRVGHHYAQANGAEILTVTHPDGYNWIVPSVNQWYRWTLATTTNPRGISYDTATHWLVTQVSVDHDNESGTKTVQVTYARETSGAAGQTVAYPAPAQTSNPYSSIPPFDPYISFPDLPSIFLPPNPGTGDIPPFTGNTGSAPSVPTNGNTVMIWTDSQVWLTKNFLSASPTWTEITPTGAVGIVDCKFDNSGTGAYILAGASGSWSNTIDLTASDGGFSPSSGSSGSYSAGTGWVHSDYFDGTTYNRGLDIQLSFSSATVTTVEFTYTLTKGSYNDGGQVAIRIWSPISTIVKSQSFNGSSSGTAAFTYTTLHSSTGVRFFLRSSRQSSAVYSGAARITAVTISGTGTNPFGGGSSDYSVYYTSNVFAAAPTWTEGDAITGAFNMLRLTSTSQQIYAFNPGGATARYSTDRGATWAAAIAVGTSAGAIAGGDTIKIGTVSLFGADNQIKKNTTNGGAYSNYGIAMASGTDPTAIVIPRYIFGSASTTNASTNTPEYLVGSTALSAGNAGLWKVTSSGATFTDITPVLTGQYGKAQTANCLAMPWRSGSRIAAILTFNTTRHLVTSINAGAAWTDRGALTATADYIHYRKGDTTLNQLFGIGYADATKPFYSPNHGAALYEKTSPTTDDLLGIQVYG